MPLAIVDTGASHTLISRSFAAAAGLELAGPKVAASGSMAFESQTAVLKELAIGPLVLRNVPVNVGDPPPLAMTQAKAALGVDVMQHLRFTIDYPRGRVRVRPAGPRAAPEPPNPAAWDIPLHTYPEHTFAEARLPSGASARTIVDSGNFAATLVWGRWGQENLPGRKKPARDMVDFVRGKPTTEIKGLTLGGRELPPWPAMDMPPMTLAGVDLVDVLMGHDLLSQYVATVDMQGRVLRLAAPSGTAPAPRAPDAALLKLMER
jgi:hypothetical protein